MQSSVTTGCFLERSFLWPALHVWPKIPAAEDGRSLSQDLPRGRGTAVPSQSSWP